MIGLRRPVLAGALTLTLAASGAHVAAQAPSTPTPTQPVNDFAQVIDADSARAMDARIRALQTATGDAVIVAAVPTLEPFGSIEEYAVRMFEQAKIGQKGKDNGALIVVAVKEHKVRIEVGYGLEEFLTDGFCGDTIRQSMLPSFRRNDYGAGLLAGTTAVINRIADRRGVTLQNVPRPARQPDSGSGIPIGMIILIIIIVLFLIQRGGGGRSRGFGPFIGGVGPFGGGFGGGFGGRGFGGGGGGGGFGGFGGGSSGGGGASGSW